MYIVNVVLLKFYFSFILTRPFNSFEINFDTDMLLGHLVSKSIFNGDSASSLAFIVEYIDGIIIGLVGRTTGGTVGGIVPYLPLVLIYSDTISEIG